MGRAASEDAVKRAKAKAPRKKRAVAPGKPKDGFHLGARLTHARLLHQMRLKDVAARAGCSESMLSKIENELASPSLTTLHRLCKALTLSISDLLSNGKVDPWVIMRPDERKTIGHRNAAGSEGVSAEVLIPSAEGRLLDGFLVVIQPSVKTNGVLKYTGAEVRSVVAGPL